jgi:hypothetical protein
MRLRLLVPVSMQDVRKTSNRCSVGDSNDASYKNIAKATCNLLFLSGNHALVLWLRDYIMHSPN